MVASVDYQCTTFQPIPQRLEAGTPPIAQVIGLGAAIDYMQEHAAFDLTQPYEHELALYMLHAMQTFQHINIVGAAGNTGNLVSFTVEGMHAHDVATILDQSGVCIRAGTHCAQPIARKMGISSWLRASIAFYNTKEDVDMLIQLLKDIKKAI
jgi:cysteine desulfurase/selenocysteine lyase